jgi:hypothetical protein
LNTSSDLTSITVLKLAENPQINDIAAQARTMLERVADRLGA